MSYKDKTVSIERILASSHFFVGLWPYCADWPISVTGKATATDTTGSRINSKEMLDIYDVKGTTSKVILYLHLKHLNTNQVLLEFCIALGFLEKKEKCFNWSFNRHVPLLLGAFFTCFLFKISGSVYLSIQWMSFIQV